MIEARTKTIRLASHYHEAESTKEALRLLGGIYYQEFNLWLAGKKKLQPLAKKLSAEALTESSSGHHAIAENCFRRGLLAQCNPTAGNQTRCPLNHKIGAGQVCQEPCEICQVPLMEVLGDVALHDLHASGQINGSIFSNLHWSDSIKSKPTGKYWKTLLAQRPALPAAGEEKARKRKTAKAQKKSLKKPQTPGCPVHAVLGGFIA